MAAYLRASLRSAAEEQPKPTVAVREHSACGNPPVEAALGIAQLSATIPPPRAAVDCAPAGTGNARKFCK